MINEIRSMCVISDGYPSRGNSEYSFVQELVEQFAKNGIDCCVVVPQSISHALVHRGRVKERTTVNRHHGGCIRVLRPPYLSLSGKMLYALTRTFFWHACRRAVKDRKFDVYYGHFLHNGVIAAALAERNGGRACAAAGESKFKAGFLQANMEKLKKLHKVIAVSSEMKKRCVEMKFCSPEDILVCPNAINPGTFHRMDRAEARKQLHWGDELFVAAYVGAFSQRKGIQRVMEALGKEQGVTLCLIGSGDPVPEADNVLFKGRLLHEQIPLYLNASDVFVLPTLAEGCCNAIVEAMACGLPIVSSNGEFNDDILDAQCAIRINSNDVAEIRAAVLKLRDDAPLRQRLSEGALKKSGELTIAARAEKILSFLKE